MLYRYILIAFLSSASMLLASEWQHTRWQQLKQCRDNIQHMHVNLLLLRRHEKDFLARKLKRYITDWQDRFDQNQSTQEGVSVCFKNHTEGQKLLQQLQHQYEEYQRLFLLFVLEIKNSSSQEQVLINDIVTLQERIEMHAQHGSVDLLSQLIQIRQSLFSYIVERRVISLELLLKKIMEIDKQGSGNAPFTNSLKNYKTKVIDLNGLISRLSESHKYGVHAQMRAAAHSAEQIISTELPQQMKVNESKARTQGYLWFSLVILVNLLLAIKLGLHQSPTDNRTT